MTTDNMAAEVAARTAAGLSIRATHPYGFRSGEWAEVTGVAFINGRPCFAVVFPDGARDTWVVYDPSDSYEFKGSAESADSGLAAAIRDALYEARVLDGATIWRVAEDAARALGPGTETRTRTGRPGAV